MVTREEKERRKKTKEDRHFWIKLSVGIALVIIAGFSLYFNYGQSDKINSIDNRISKLKEHIIQLDYEMEYLNKRLDNIQTARTDTSGK